MTKKPTFYVLKGHTPVPFAGGNYEFLSPESRRVAITNYKDILISTIFLSMDHNYDEAGPPILFETKVFNGNKMYEMACERYSTWKEAEGGHFIMCQKFIPGYTKDDFFLDML